MNLKLPEYDHATIRTKRPVERLHYLTQDGIAGYGHAALAELACKGGIKWVQLRSKGYPVNEWERIALEVKEVIAPYGAALIINDNPLLAKKTGADGVHLGKEDMSPAGARQLLGQDAIIGATVNNMEDLKRALDQPVDYIGMGPYRFTQTKEKLSPVLNEDQLEQMLSFQNRLPVILIGGIQKEDAKKILAMGAHGIAVSSAINMEGDKTATAADFVKIIAG
jgi:thiamine-phosphate pyrophosphorylase